MSLHVKLSRIRPRRPRSSACIAYVPSAESAPLAVPCGIATPAAQRRNYNASLNHFVHAPPVESPSTFRLAVKDNIAVNGFPTTCASNILARHRSPFEATIVTQLRKRGAVVVGKTNMDEFGMGSHSAYSIYGPVKNPLLAPKTSPREESLEDEDGRKAGSKQDKSPMQDNGERGGKSASEDTGAASLSPGGSSGGSAVAVAIGDADLALGTDTGGSIRLPAAYCGVVGYKPSYGLVSRYGVIPYANSLDTVGILARETKAIRNLFTGPSGLDTLWDPNDPTSLPDQTRRRINASLPRPEDVQLANITIGVPVEYNTAELDPNIRAAWLALLEHLREAYGTRIVPVSLPSTRHALGAYYIIAPAEASSNLAKFDGVRFGRRSDGSDGAGGVLYANTRGEGFGEEVKRRILLGSYSLSSAAMDNYFKQAQRVRRLVQRDFDKVFRLPNPLRDAQQFDLTEMDETIELETKLGPTQVDFLLSPTAPGFPPQVADVQKQLPVEGYMNDVLTVPASLAGLPSVSVPVGGPFWESGGKRKDNVRRPMGMQVIGQYWDDVRLLELAGKIEKAYLESDTLGKGT